MTLPSEVEVKFYFFYVKNRSIKKHGTVTKSETTKRKVTTHKYTYGTYIQVKLTITFF